MADIKILNNDIVSFEGTVGIGTASPSHKLHVEGSVNITDDLTFGIGGFLGTSSAVFEMYSLGDIIYNTDSNNNGTSSHIFKESNNELMRINSSGNVGIGTTSPDRKLEVENTSGVGEMCITGTTGSTLYFKPTDSYSLGGNFGIFVTGIGAPTYESTMTFKGYGSGINNLMTLKGSGNVGIGTTTPINRLQVARTSNGRDVAYFGGQVRIAEGDPSRLTIADKGGSANLWNFDNAGGTLRVFREDYASSGTGSNGSVKLAITDGGNVGIGTTSPSAKLEVNGTFKSAGIQDSANANAIFINGNEEVGIGTTSPTQKLDVAGTIRTEGNLFMAKGTDPRIYAGSGVGLNIDGELLYLNRYTSSNIAMVTGGGNVGIGTTSPGAKLQVSNGSSGFTGSYNGRTVAAFEGSLGSGTTISILSKNTGYSGIFFGDQDDEAAGQLQYDHTFNGFRFLYGGGSELMRTTSAGNVGINTTNPLAKLDVQMSDANGTYGRGKDGNLNLENTNTANTEGGWMSISGYMGNAVSQYQMGAISGGKQTTAGDGNYGGYLTFWTTSGGGNGEANSGMYERMRIDTTGVTSIYNGTINLGTDSVASVINSIGDLFIFNVDSNNNTGGTPNFRFRIGSATDIATINGTGLGIGTTSPSYKLSVNTNGDVYSADFYQANSGTDKYNAIRVRGAMTSAVGYYGIGGSTASNTSFRDAFVVGTQSSHSLNLATSDTARVTITSGGNVGIGKTNPFYKFEVSNGTITGTFNPNSSGFMFLGSTTSHPLHFGTSDTTKMAITTGGNVGIGTASPSARLHIEHANTTSGLYVFTQSSAVPSVPQIRIGRDAGQYFGVLTDDGTSRLMARQDETGTGTHSMDFEIWSDIANKTFSWQERLNDGSSPTYRMVLKNGDLGIGTVSPSEKLHVVGNIKAEGSVGVTNIVTNRIVKFNGSILDDSLLYDNGTNVGIGTTTPTAKLQVGGGTSNTQSSVAALSGSYQGLLSTLSLVNQTANLVTDGGVALDFHLNSAYSPTGRITTRTEDASNPTSSYMQFFTYLNGLNERMRITSAGKVGIGTISPVIKLDVNSSGSDSVARFTSTDSRARILIEDDTDISYFGTYIGTTFIGSDDTPSGNTLNVTSSGNVGIGTTNPVQPLQVDGNIYSNGGDIYVNNSKALIAVGDLVFKTYDTSYAERMRILANGQVGIGVTSVPTGYKMQVAGSILASGHTSKFTISNIDYYNRVGQYYGAMQLAVWSYNNSTSTQSNTGTIQLGSVGPNTYNNNVIVSNGNLTVNGNGSFTGDVVAYSSSDKRLKDNVKPIENALDKVIAIGGYEFDWNENQEVYEGHDVGVIAQEVEEVLPEVVETRKDGYKAVKYEKMVPLLIEAIKDQQKQIEELKALLNGSTK